MTITDPELRYFPQGSERWFGDDLILNDSSVRLAWVDAVHVWRSQYGQLLVFAEGRVRRLDGEVGQRNRVGQVFTEPADVLARQPQWLRDVWADAQIRMDA